MSLASNIGSALIGTGGKAMEVAVTLWNSVCTGQGSLLNTYLSVNPATAIQETESAGDTTAVVQNAKNGISTAYKMVSTGSNIWKIGMAIGAALVVFYFFAGWIKNAINVRDDITLENIWKFVIRVMLIELLLVNIPALIEEFMTIGYAITNEIAGEVEPLPSAMEFAGKAASSKKTYTESDITPSDDGHTFYYTDDYGNSRSFNEKDLSRVGLSNTASDHVTYLNEKKAEAEANDFGYFCGIYEQISGTKTTAGEWLSAGGVCLIGGLLGALVIIVSTITLVTAVISRLFRVLISIPFAPAAIAGFAGGQEYSQRGMSWIRSFIGFLLEAVVILLAINICGAMFSWGASGTLIEAGTGTAGVLASVMNMVIPVTVTTAVATGADTLIRKIIGF